MIYDTLDSKPRPTTLLLKGPPGGGKTTKAAEFPDPVIFNWDNNLTGLRKLPEAVRKRIRVIDPRLDEKKQPVKPLDIWANYIKQLAVVTADPTVGTIINDSMTTMCEVLMDKIMGTNDPQKQPEIQHWGALERHLKWLGEEVLCANDLDKHVVFIAHERAREDKKTGEVKLVLNIGGSSKDTYDLYFSDCWRVWARPKRDNSGVDYMVRTLATDTYNAKCALAMPHEFKWDESKQDVLRQLELGINPRKALQGST